MHVQVRGRPLQLKFLVIVARYLLLCFVQKTGGEELMKLKNLAYATFVAAAAVAFVIGSAVPSEAAKKKKAAAAPPPPPPQIVCAGGPAPVCATKGDQKFTYHNACWAAKDRATAAKPGACKAAKAAGGKKKAKKKKA
jgi:hypothetical protein